MGLPHFKKKDFIRISNEFATQCGYRHTRRAIVVDTDGYQEEIAITTEFKLIMAEMVVKLPNGQTVTYPYCEFDTVKELRDFLEREVCKH